MKKLKEIIREVIQEDDKEKLINLLKSYDWNAAYSDDSRVYKSSESDYKEISNLVSKLGAEGRQILKDMTPKAKIPNTGRYTKKESLADKTLEKRDSVMQDLKGQKRDFVKRYGKDAEKVMVGRATNIAKGKLAKERIKEAVKKVLK